MQAEAERAVLKRLDMELDEAASRQAEVRAAEVRVEGWVGAAAHLRSRQADRFVLTA